jgi:RHS repeat-associated protein
MNANAQGPATGVPPFGSFSGGPDVINLANLNVHWTFPFLRKPGRGTDFAYDMTYDSSVWYQVTSNGTTSWQPVPTWGLRGVTEVVTGYINYSTTFGSCYDPDFRRRFNYTAYTYLYYHDAFGVAHSINRTVYTSVPCPLSPGPSTATVSLNDGSTVTVTANPSATVHAANGATLNPPLQQGTGTGNFTDRNGNKIAADASGHFYDTLSSTTPVLTASGSGTPTSPMVFTYTSSAGPAGYTMKYAAYTVQTTFACNGVTNYGPTGTSLLNEIDLPDGSKYTFAYELTVGGTAGAVTGRLQSVKLPTGGTITYTYSGGDNSHNGITCSDGSAAGLMRQTPDGTWTYARSGSTTTIAAPLLSYDSTANNTVLTFNSNSQETSRQIYQGAATGTPLRTINTTWASNGTPSFTTVVLEDGSTQAATATTYDSFGNLLSETEYDFGTGTHGAAIRTITNTFLSYIPVFPTRVVISDGTGAPKSRTDITYDNYTSPNTMTCRTTPITQHDDTNFGCSYTARGNATSFTLYTDPVTPGGAITKYTSYDQLGNVVGADLSCCQRKTWAFTTTTNYAYPDSVTTGSSSPTLKTNFTYDLNMGRVLTSTDPNNLKTTFTYDTVGRVTSTQPTTTPVMPATTYSYNDFDNSATFTPWTVQVCAAVQSTNTICQKGILDSQGRPITQQTLDGNTILYSATDTQYDTVGRAYRVSNPYTSSPANWTETRMDALGRAVKTILPDSSNSTAIYTTTAVKTTDPTGKQRQFLSDGSGRTIMVWEPDPASGNTLTLQTSYGYNVLDALTTVTQGPQTRAYTYDALSRLTSSTTPEGGRVCFGSVSGTTCNADGYDPFNNLVKRTDARGVVTNYSYDSLNRLYQVSYNVSSTGVPATPTITLTYGTDVTQFNNGRRKSMTDGVGSESYTYDVLGRVIQLDKIIYGITYTTKYTYNFAGELVQITYPSNRIVVPSYDAIGRPCAVGTSASTCTTGTFYASGFGFNAAQQVTGFKYGNGIFASLGFSTDRLQLTCLDYSTTNRNGNCTHDSTTKFGLNYSFGTAGTNNGQIVGITDSVDNGRSATFSYDALNRLSTATTTGSANYSAWGLSMVYDRYGNRTDQNQTAGNPPSNHVLIDTATNRISGDCYDASGNLLAESASPCPSPTYTYDAENHVVNYMSANPTYVYDGNGLRVKKCLPNCTSPTSFTVYIFSGSKVIAEYDNGAAAASPSREFIYAGGALLAKIDSSGTKYYHQDHLSNRLITDSSGNTFAQLGHYAFGESWYNATNDKLLFATYERDSESGNDYSMARYDVNRLGRFSSPDPIAGSLSAPQSLNRYPYVANDPVDFVDPSGTTDCPQGKTCGEPWTDPFNPWADWSGLFGRDLWGFFGWADFWGGDAATEARMFLGFLTRSDFLLVPGFQCHEFPGVEGEVCYNTSDLNYYDYRGRGGDGSRQEPDQEEKTDCFAQLKYRPVDDWRAKIRKATHAFWYVQDNTGSQYTISAGPTDPNGSGYLNVWVTEGTTGQLPGDKHTAKTAWSSGLSPDNCDKVDKLLQAAWDFPNNEIVYGWNGPNSNSAANYLATAGGFSVTKPPGSVGWGKPIPGLP